MTVSYNFATAWESIADAQPEVRALVQGDRVVSWGDFDDRAARLAQGLLDRGVGQGAKVASYLYNSNEYMEGVFATWKLRGAPVNVNYRYLEDELLYLVDNSDAEVLLFHGVLAEHVARIMDRAATVKVWVFPDWTVIGVGVTLTIGVACAVPDKPSSASAPSGADSPFGNSRKNT